jgi:hypothetical protein
MPVTEEVKKNEERVNESVRFSLEALYDSIKLSEKIKELRDTMTEEIKREIKTEIDSLNTKFNLIIKNMCDIPNEEQSLEQAAIACVDTVSLNTVSVENIEKNNEQLVKAQNNISSKTRKNIVDTLSTTFTKIKSQISKFLNLEQQKSFNDSVSETEKNGSEAVNENGLTSTDKIKQWSESSKNLKQEMERYTDLKNKIISEKGPAMWEKVKIMISALTLVSGIGGFIWFMKAYTDEHTGCFMWYSGKKTKLSCSEWYKNNGKEKCTCGIVTTPAKDPDCGKFSINDDECTAPYCLGRQCKNDKESPELVANPSGTKSCNILYGHRLLCTPGSLTDEGSVSYGWQEVSPLEAIASIPAAIGSLVTDVENNILNILKSLVKWIPIVIGSILLLFILFAVVKVIISKYKNKVK